MSKEGRLIFSRPSDLSTTQRREVLKVLESSPEIVKIVRELGDFTIDCKVSKGPREFWRIDTGIKLLDKLIHILSYYSRFNIELIVNYKSNKPSYSVIEYSGKVLGEAFKIIAKERAKKYGINGYGYSQGVFKEAFSEARVSLESGAGFWITRGQSVKVFGRLGELTEESIKSFFEEFANGINATIHLDLVRSESPYNLWTSAFIAFGDALRQVFMEDEWSRQEKEIGKINI